MECDTHNRLIKAICINMNISLRYNVDWKKQATEWHTPYDNVYVGNMQK